jgi:hypothetical protein
MPRCVPPELQRTRCCSVRLHPSEEAQLRAAAAQQGRQFGPFLREVLIHRFDALAPPPPLPPGVPRAVLAALHEVLDRLVAGYATLDRAYQVIAHRRNLTRSREHLADLLRQVAEQIRHQHESTAAIITLASPTTETASAP